MAIAGDGSQGGVPLPPAPRSESRTGVRTARTVAGGAGEFAKEIAKTAKISWRHREDLGVLRGLAVKKNATA